jgi:transcriptional regulator with XRE-family HTH domain
MIYSVLNNSRKLARTAQLPLPVRTALRKLGADVRDARLRRRISTTIMAQRAQVARMTLHKVERGDPTVSMGTYATVLFVLGMTDRFAELADVRFDRLGLLLEEERLPQRIRSTSRRPKPVKAAGNR